MKKFIALVLISTLLVLLYLLNMDLKSKKTEVLSPTPVPETKTSLELTGWFSYFDEDKSAISLQYVFPYLKIFSPALYEVTDSGGLKKLTVNNKQKILSEAKLYNLPMFPVINDGGKREKLLPLLRDDDKREEFVNDLISEAENEGFSGFSLDFESIKSEDKDDFISMSKYFYEKLHENNLELHNILFGREENETYDSALAQPYKELSQYADKIYLMVYNFNNPDTNPGGQTPRNWYKRVLDYAVKTVPLEKLVIGLSGHGYMWTGSKITGLSYWDVENILLKENPQIKYDPSQFAETFNFQNGDTESTVFYDDSRAIIDKVKLAKTDYGITKFAIWRIGAEDPKIWADLNNFK